jgi:hypothetical protein
VEAPLSIGLPYKWHIHRYGNLGLARGTRQRGYYGGAGGPAYTVLPQANFFVDLAA